MNWKLLSLAALGFVLTGCDGKKEEKNETKPAEAPAAPAQAPAAPAQAPKADEVRPAEPAPAEMPAPEEKKPE